MKPHTEIKAKRKEFKYPAMKLPVYQIRKDSPGKPINKGRLIFCHGKPIFSEVGTLALMFKCVYESIK